MRARRWFAARLGEERLAFLAALPLDLTLDVAGLGPIRFCHGAPGSDELDPELRGDPIGCRLLLRAAGATSHRVLPAAHRRQGRAQDS